jgi:hypothetical protein
MGHSEIRPRNEAASSAAQYARSARAIAPKVAASVRSFPENGGVVSGGIEMLNSFQGAQEQNRIGLMRKPPRMLSIK